jgi:hypothetical protein
MDPAVVICALESDYGVSGTKERAPNLEAAPRMAPPR